MRTQQSGHPRRPTPRRSQPDGRAVRSAPFSGVEILRRYRPKLNRVLVWCVASRDDQPR
jgi:hypothetical protein